jgi:hypothetical protein
MRLLRILFCLLVITGLLAGCKKPPESTPTPTSTPAVSTPVPPTATPVPGGPYPVLPTPTSGPATPYPALPTPTLPSTPYPSG